jgi:hypothetical protein
MRVLESVRPLRIFLREFAFWDDGASGNCAWPAGQTGERAKTERARLRVECNYATHAQLRVRFWSTHALQYLKQYAAKVLGLQKKNP